MKPGAIMVDTNVWLDYFLGRGEAAGRAARLLTAIKNHGSIAATTDGICRDVYYMLRVELKRMNAGDQERKSSHEAINQIALACLKAMSKMSLNLPGFSDDVLRALALMRFHNDFEDNLLIAACESNNVTLLVTSDTKLRKHSPVSCLTVPEAIEYLEV